MLSDGFIALKKESDHGIKTFMFPFHKTIIAALVLVCTPVLATAKSPLANPDDLSQSQLEQRLAEIDTELEQLASYSLRSGVGSVGYQSKPHRSPDNKGWIRPLPDGCRPRNQEHCHSTAGKNSLSADPLNDRSGAIVPRKPDQPAYRGSEPYHPGSRT